RRPREAFEIDPTGSVFALHGRHDRVVDVIADLLQYGFGSHARKIAVFEFEFAEIRHRIDGDAAADRARLYGGEGDVERVVVWTLSLVAVGNIANLADDARGVLDGVQSLGRERRMRRMAVHPAPKRIDAFVSDDGAHAGGFAHDAAAWIHATLNQLLNHGRCADAADFLIVGVRQVEGMVQPGLEHFRHELQGHTD